MLGFLIGLLVLVADVWAILNIVQSRAGGGAKAVWVVVILLLPVLGLVVWLVAGPRRAAVGPA